MSVTSDTRTAKHTKQMKTTTKNQVPRGVQILRERGWTYRTAAKHLGVTFQHLHRVARDERISARLNRKIEELPVKKEAV